MSWLNKPYSMLALTTIMIGLPVMFIAAIPWLKQQPESVVYLCAGIAATGTVVASFGNSTSGTAAPPVSRANGAGSRALGPSQFCSLFLPCRMRLLLFLEVSGT